MRLTLIKSCGFFIQRDLGVTSNAVGGFFMSGVWRMKMNMDGICLKFLYCYFVVQLVVFHFSSMFRVGCLEYFYCMEQFRALNNLSMIHDFIIFYHSLSLIILCLFVLIILCFIVFKYCFKDYVILFIVYFILFIVCFIHFIVYFNYYLSYY